MSSPDPCATAATEHVITITPRTVYDVVCSCTGHGWKGVSKEHADAYADGHRKWVEKRRAE